MIGPTRAFCLTLSLLALPLRTLHAAPLFDGPRQVVPTGLSPMCVCAEDMDLDGRVDIVTPVLNGNAIELHLATGEGDFGPALCVPTPRGPRALAIGDLDGDGWPDLVSGNYLARSITSYRNLGGGRFELIDEISVAGAPQSLALGDLDGDGHLDLVVADPLSDSLLVFGGNGNGRLHARRGRTFPVPTAVMVNPFGSPGQKAPRVSRPAATTFASVCRAAIRGPIWRWRWAPASPTPPTIIATRWARSRSAALRTSRRRSPRRR